jgi:hypothetical protein
MKLGGNVVDTVDSPNGIFGPGRFKPSPPGLSEAIDR